MGGSSKAVTVGYWYGLSVHFGVCYGPVDAFEELTVDDRVAWSGSASSGTISIDQPELFGGKAREGGLQGNLTIMSGAPSQSPNSYLAEQLGHDVPAFRGIFSLLWNGLLSANNPYIKPFSFKVKRILQGWNGGTAWYPTRAAIGNDMNPAHIIYQAHTDPQWGMGYPVSSINDANFRAVADQLYAEGFGLSMLWNRQASVEQFQQEILNHIGGILLTNPRTGLFEIKLIRDDADPGSLPSFDPSNCTLEDFQRGSIGDLTNEVTVVYTDAATGKSVPLTVQNLAMVQSQGGVVSSTVSYPGITSPTIAARVADRDLRAKSSPLAKVRLRCNRTAWDTLPGDCILLNWPEQGINGVVYRVLGVGLGTLKSGYITLDCAEDVFGLPDASYVAQEPVGWTDPGSAPAASPSRYVAEAPYFDLARELSEADLATVTTTDCYVSVTSRQPSNDSYDPTLWTRTGSGTWAEIGRAQHCPVGILNGAHAKGATTLSLRSGIALDLVETGGYLAVGGELMRVDAINVITQTVTVSPGVLDTVPAAHADGEVVFFVDGFQTNDGVQYATGETVQVRLQTQTTRGILPFASAPTDSYTMQGRQARPYPPGNLQINGVYYAASATVTGGSITISWAHRDRLQQTATIIAQNAGSIGPEAGTTYNLRVYSGPSLLQSYTGLTGTSQAVPVQATVALLHFDGASGSTVFSDDTGNVWTRTGNAQISNLQSVFGGASGLFDGVGDFITTPHRDAYNGLTDLTVEARIFTNVNNAIKCIIKKGTTAATSGWWMSLDAAGRLTFNMADASGIMTCQGATVLATGTWYRVAAVKIGNVVTIYVNGTADGTLTLPRTPAVNANTLTIGRDSVSAARDWSGNIDELRVSVIGRYSGAYSDPGAPFTLASDSPPSSVRIELESVRGGLTSWQMHNHTVALSA